MDADNPGSDRLVRQVIVPECLALPAIPYKKKWDCLVGARWKRLVDSYQAVFAEYHLASAFRFDSMDLILQRLDLPFPLDLTEPPHSSVAELLANVATVD